jgi:hypothetical protein
MEGNIKVIEAEDFYKRITKNIIYDKEINVVTLGVFVRIVSCSKDWNLNIKGLASALGLSDRKTRECIVLLEKKGYLKRVAACWNLVKDINSKAIHNGAGTDLPCSPLLESCQRYKFKSNSQRLVQRVAGALPCWNLVKDINSKAIHNCVFFVLYHNAPVGILSKI